MTNLTLIQFFHWYYSPEGNLWQHAADQAAHMASLGITHVWLPPAYKSADGVNEPGYAVYDLFDLGEFDQKGTVRTRYGTKKEYLDCIKKMHKNGLQVLADIVLNHKQGGDEKELIPVQQVDAEDRNKMIGEKKEIEAYTKFIFPGRKGKYSNYIWDWHSFTGIDGGWENQDKIYIILNGYGNSWKPVPDGEKGNYDYLMANDIELRNPNVVEELKWWGRWYIETAKIDGFRLDALKHITPDFFNDWLDHLKDHFKKDFFCIGEYWKNDIDYLLKYIDATQGKIQLADVPLHFNFTQASLKRNQYDLRHIFDNTLLQHKPERAITFIDNQDTQPLRSLESTVDYWFKPLAYSLILLREQGIPCVFYPALYSAKYSGHANGKEVFIELNSVPLLEAMLRTRKKIAYGRQRDYFDHPNTVGWTREGVNDKPLSGCAVLITNGTAGNKMMEVGEKHSNKSFVDICGNRKEKVKIDKNGHGEFFVNDESVSVWINEEAVKFFK
jgi:alpha-amylase